MNEQRTRARAASKFGVDLRAGVKVEGQTAFARAASGSVSPPDFAGP